MWVWDPEKSRSNRTKHGLDFKTAQGVFLDPMRATRLDPFPDEERWQTIGRLRAGGPVVVVVVHTDVGSGGRIISARKASKHERKAYEDGVF